MSYMTIEEQIASHLAFLKARKLAVDELQIEKGFIRCHHIGQSEGRGELCYRTRKTVLRNGCIGLATWARLEGGQVKMHKTYGLPSNEPISDTDVHKPSHVKAVENVEAFWRLSSQTGEATYLLQKGVGYYGIRFRSTDYGKVAVIPMRDLHGQLLSYQLINADGSKRFAKTVETKGLLHMLHIPIDGYTIGLAESYVTAATCFEITGMTMITAFSSDNLKEVGIALSKQYRNSRLIVFGDNDRHLEMNKGKQAAYAIKESLGIRCQIVIPEFNGYPLERKFSDWNDFVREEGIKNTRKEMQRMLYYSQIREA